ncbi:MAG TPA: UbiA family prenyltransferase, partial [Pyrinomonadaceae bacterium]|nr:UbiA family prenyltransferase [Pyrinomonadaceae bacterium]
MKGVALEINSEVPSAVAAGGASARGKFAALVELTKPRITFLIVLTSAAGFALGSRGGLDYLSLFNTLFGIALLSSGIATLNQYMERDLDGRMRRTAARPLPAGKLTPARALWFGAA